MDLNVFNLSGSFKLAFQINYKESDFSWSVNEQIAILWDMGGGKGIYAILGFAQFKTLNLT